MKLKMEKADDASATTSDKGKKPSDTLVPPEETEQKEDVETLRKVIKLNDNEDEKKTEEKQELEPKKDAESNESDLLDGVDDLAEDAGEQATNSPTSSREELEQKRAILQRIKDFDFQIKKNQQDIGSIGEKITALSKDLDDLVSLYEIVSEQMNPFVGLSKVTKKRLESLENINNEINSLKEKLSTLESGGAIQTVQKSKVEMIEPSFEMDLSDQDINRIIELSFSELTPEATVEDTIDNAIDVFIENLKAGNVN
ncbi:MAG: flagella accessory protein C [Candidatus Thermoplasmatota archaeon]|nr:flagella accessory protein C [Candidatus Thermoplasmatota archaeon]